VDTNKCVHKTIVLDYSHFVQTVRIGRLLFFQKNGKIKQQVNVAALGTRHAALRTAFELHGSYAPTDPKEAAQYGVKVIQVDIVRPPNYFRQFIDVPPQKPKPMMPPSGNGKPPADSNGDD
jgi:hypothetical protein